MLFLHHQSLWLLFPYVCCIFFFFSLSLSCVPSIFLSLFSFFFSFPPDALAWMNSWYNCVCAWMFCMWLCVCVYFLTFLRFSVSKSLVRDERKVCGHARAYSKCVETSHLPQRASCLQGCALPSLLLSSAEPCKCGCHSWSTSSKGELAFLWYTVVLKFLPLNTSDQAVSKTGPMTYSKGV